MKDSGGFTDDVPQSNDDDQDTSQFDTNSAPEIRDEPLDSIDEIDPGLASDAVESDWLGEDIEQAYLRALEANQAVEWEIGTTLTPDGDVSAEHVGEPRPAIGENSNADPAVDSALSADGVIDTSSATPGDSSADASATCNTPPSVGIDPTASAQTDVATHSSMAADLANVDRTNVDRANVNWGDVEARGPRITPAQIIEAAMFVGGAPLKVKKLAAVLREEFTPEYIEQSIEELNRQYAGEERPYEIRLSEGGYRLQLRPEFERVCSRVYGQGPKEIKLSQDVLEVLALVAYHQPITKKQIDQFGKRNAGGILRQLLRRELIALERSESSKADVTYKTAPRFLAIFGLGNIDELPRAEELSLK